MHLYGGGVLGQVKNAGFLGWHFIISIIGAEANPFVLRQTPLRWLRIDIDDSEEVGELITE